MGRLLSRLESYGQAEPWLQKGTELTAASGFEDGATDTMKKYADCPMQRTLSP